MGDSKWVTVKEVAQVRNCSERYVLKLIAQNVLKAKKNGRRWLVLLDSSELTQNSSTLDSQTTIKTSNKTDWNNSELVRIANQQLEDKNNEIKYLKEQLEQKDRQIESIQKSADESRERSDTIIMTLSKNLSETQKALEMKNMSWWKKLKLNKRKEKDEDKGK